MRGRRPVFIPRHSLDRSLTPKAPSHAAGETAAVPPRRPPSAPRATHLKSCAQNAYGKVHARVRNGGPTRRSPQWRCGRHLMDPRTQIHEAKSCRSFELEREHQHRKAVVNEYGQANLSLRVNRGGPLLLPPGYDKGSIPVDSGDFAFRLDNQGADHSARREA